MTDQSTQTLPAGLDQALVDAFAREWYAALDEHLPLQEVLRHLVDDGLEMRFPEGTSRGHEGFSQWYDAVTHRFFDEEHSVRVAEVQGVTAEGTVVSVIVNWQARIWDAPAPRSAWLGFDAYQTWVVVAGPEGTPQIRTYVVDELRPMPGSASL